ncbi:MAG: hypothetical protein AB7F88_17755 [Pyrinomonadaceae bacterium]
MRLPSFVSVAIFAVVVLFSYNTSNAQVVDAVKDAASVTKKAVVKGAKEVADTTGDVADVTGDVSKSAAKKTVKTSKKVGKYSIDVTEGVSGAAYEGGKWFVVTTWDGTKWVSKKVWYATKKGADATKDFVVGDGEKKP